MAISKKLNKSITTALITLLMLSTFIGLISFAGATTSSPSTTVLSGTGDGTAKWVDTQKTSGDFSVALGTDSTSDTAQVKIPTNFLFGTSDLGDEDFLNTTILVAAGGASIATDLKLKLFMDSNNDGASDYTLTTPLGASVSTWTAYSGNTWTAVNTTKASSGVYGIASSATSTYTALNATSASDDSVVAVAVTLTGVGNLAFVDIMGIPTAIYNLEPIALTLNQAGAAVQQTTPTAPCGDTVYVMAANGTFTASESVSIFFSGIAGARNQVPATPNGGLFAWFNVPEKAAGSYTIEALGTLSGKTFTGPFTIATPTVTLDPAVAVPGSIITITGTNFALNGHVNMTFNGVAWGTSNVTVAANGTFSTTAVVPTLATGTYTVSVTDNVNTKTASFEIPAPTITLSPTSGPAGKNIAVKGVGFSQEGLVRIYFGGQLVWSTTADAWGNLTGTTGVTITVPDKLANAYTVTAIDATTSASSNDATFTVSSPSIKVAPVSGPAGSSFIINGTNFKVNAQVNVKFNGISLANITTDDQGTTAGRFANATLTIPSIAPGTYSITASDGVNSATEVSFTVPAAAITLAPSSGPAGTAFYVAGTNFKVNSAIAITFNGTAITGATSSPTGTFNQSQTVPAYPIGAYTVNATDGITFATATFNIGAAISTLNATQGPVGSGLNVQGMGFTNSATVEVYFDSTLVKTLNATSTGTINTNFVVPDVLAGVYQVTAYDVSTAVTTPAMNFTVQAPTLTVTDPATAEGQTGTVAMISGTLYKLDSTVSIYFNGELVATVVASHTGALPSNANFTVPSVVPGAYTISATDGVNTITATFNVYGTGGIDEVLSIVNEIKATLAEYGSFYNFTNTWFTTIDNKLGNFTGEDTVASLLYSIQSKVNLPSELVFDFGGPSADDMTAIHVSNATEYSIDTGFGWIDITDLQFRERATAARKDFKALICSQEAAVFQVALPNGEYIVSVFQGDADWAHDDMTIIANGEFINTVNSAKGQVVPTDFKVTVEDGLLQITFDDAGGADGNWVLNGLVIRQNWAPAQ